MSLCLLVRSLSAPRYAAICLILMLGEGLSAPLSAQSPTRQPETLVFRPGIDVGPGNQTIEGSLAIGPWSFGAIKFHSVTDYDAGLYEYADNGTPFIASVGGGHDFPITLERFDGSPFSLVGFDAAEGFLDDLLAAEEGFASAAKIEVEAALASGFTLTLEFDLDSLRDGPGGADDFESFTMPDDLQSVTSVTFTGLVANRRDAGFALDNIVVAAVVPEPGSAALAFVGAIGLVVVLAKRHRRREIGRVSQVQAAHESESGRLRGQGDEVRRLAVKR